MYYYTLQLPKGRLAGVFGPIKLNETESLDKPIRDYKNGSSSVRSIWRSASKIAERTDLVAGQDRVNLSARSRRTNSVASWFLEHGVQPGDQGAIVMRNYQAWMLLYWAGSSIGVRAIIINPWWTLAKMAELRALSNQIPVFVNF